MALWSEPQHKHANTFLPGCKQTLKLYNMKCATLISTFWQMHLLPLTSKSTQYTYILIEAPEENFWQPNKLHTRNTFTPLSHNQKPDAVHFIDIVQFVEKVI